jgi:hypothetical protein
MAGVAEVIGRATVNAGDHALVSTFHSNVIKMTGERSETYGEAMGFDPSLCRCYNSFFPLGCADRNQDVQAVSPKAVNPGKNKIVIGGR